MTGTPDSVQFRDLSGDRVALFLDDPAGRSDLLGTLASEVRYGGEVLRSVIEDARSSEDAAPNDIPIATTGMNDLEIDAHRDRLVLRLNDGEEAVETELSLDDAQQLVDLLETQSDDPTLLAVSLTNDAVSEMSYESVMEALFEPDIVLAAWSQSKTRYDESVFRVGKEVTVECRPTPERMWTVSPIHHRDVLAHLFQVIGLSVHEQPIMEPESVFRIAIERWSGDEVIQDFFAGAIDEDGAMLLLEEAQQANDYDTDVPLTEWRPTEPEELLDQIVACLKDDEAPATPAKKERTTAKTT